MISLRSLRNLSALEPGEFGVSIVSDFPERAFDLSKIFTKKDDAAKGHERTHHMFTFYPTFGVEGSGMPAVQVTSILTWTSQCCCWQINALTVCSVCSITFSEEKHLRLESPYLFLNYAAENRPVD